MSNMFDNYPEISNANQNVNDPATESAKSVKKFQKRMKKNNKLIKRLVELQELNMMQEQQIVKYESPNKNTFVTKIGDGVVKALPSILISIAPMILASLFGTKNK